MGGGKSHGGGGGPGEGGGGIRDGRTLADELFANPEKGAMASHWTQVKDLVKDWREWVERAPDQRYVDYGWTRVTTPEWDEWEREDPFSDISIYLIYRDGEERVLSSFDDNNINMSKRPVYISMQTGDGFSDSLGVNDDSYLPESLRGWSHYQEARMFQIQNSEDIQEQRDRYDTRIEQLFGTRWGKAHPDAE